MVDTYSYRNSNNPSFSSTLLDSIYRSIDQEEIVVYREAMRMNQNYTSEEEELANFKRACMIEKWMEKKVAQNAVVSRNCANDSQIKKSRKNRGNSSSSSSDSSYGGGLGFLSSSETESFPVQRLKPVRTGSENEKHHKNRDQLEQKGGFLKTKSRALKIYGDLKKINQPISPGGKVAAFLNSIFAAANLKKPKLASNDDVSPSLKTSTTCSSASSFSRSCLSKTPSSRGKPSTEQKRSVRFSPVSVIIDDDDIYQKSINNQNHSKIRSVIDQELMVHILDKNRRAEEAARDFIMNYQKKIQSEKDKSNDKNRVFDRDYDDNEDDAASCASSDLFELDNLSAIGVDQRYTEDELPVYETTHLHTNRAIAKGFIL